MDDIVLDSIEVRVLGCLIEKEATTPDAYPLSLNGLRTACNQKTNRDPVMALSDSEVQAAIDRLIKLTFVAQRGGAGSRVVKYAHRVHDRLRPQFDFSREELAPMCLLFLRGPQTPGELRTRSARIHDFPDTDALVTVLEKLRTRDDGPYVQALPRRPGQRDVRYAHLVGGPVDAAMSDSAAQPAHGHGREEDLPADDIAERVAALEAAVEELSERFEKFVARFG